MSGRRRSNLRVWRELKLTTKRALTFGCSATMAGAAICHADAKTLPDLLAYVYNTDPKLLAERANLKSVDEKLAQARADWLPTVSAQATAGHVRDRVTGVPNQTAPGLNQIPNRSYNVSLVQPLYQGGRAAAETKNASSAIQAERAHLAATEASVLTAAATAYLDLVRDRKAVALAAANEEAGKTLMEGAIAKYGKGDGSRLDVAHATSGYTSAAIALAQAKAQLNISENALRAVAGEIGVDSEYPSSLPINLTLDEAVGLALESNPSILEAKYTSLVATDEVSVAKSSGRPTLSLRAEMEHEEGNLFAGEKEDIEAITLQLHVPIFNGGKTRSTVLQAEDGRSAAEYKLSDTRKSAEQQTVSDWELLHADKLSRETYQSEIAADRLALQGVVRQSQVGEKSVLDVVQARQNLFQAEEAYIKEERDERVHEFALASDIGRCSATGLDLDVQRYDPDRHLSIVRRRLIPIFGSADE